MVPDSGKKTFSALAVSFGHPISHLIMIALSIMDFVGKPNAVCKNLTTFSVDGNSYTLFTASTGAEHYSNNVSVLLFTTLSFIGTLHNPLLFLSLHSLLLQRQT